MSVAAMDKVDGRSHRQFGGLPYAVKARDSPSRVFSTAECHRSGAVQGEPRLRGTGLAGDVRAVDEGVGWQRGESRIKELLGPFTDKASYHAFAADQFKGKLAAYAFVLVEHFRGSTPMGTELEREEVMKVRMADLVLTALCRLRDEGGRSPWWVDDCRLGRGKPEAPENRPPALLSDATERGALGRRERIPEPERIAKNRPIEQTGGPLESLTP